MVKLSQRAPIRWVGLISIGVLSAFIFYSAHAIAANQMQSPDAKIRVQFKIANLREEKNVPQFTVDFEGIRLLAESRLGLQLFDLPPFQDLKLKQKSFATHDSVESFDFGKSATLHDHYNEYEFHLEERGKDSRKLDIVFRVANDGVSFRYFLPNQNAFKHFTITDELTTFNLSGTPKIYAIPLNFNSAYEWYYKTGTLSDFYRGQTLGLPLMIQYPDENFIGLTEANLVDYAGMYVVPSERDSAHELAVKLAPSLVDSNIKVVGDTPFSSPWRVLMIGHSPQTFLESDLIYTLNPPSAVPDAASWIKPGKIQFPWWNGYVVPTADASHVGGINTWTIKRYIDFCKRNNIPYHSIDGFDQAWYGGPVENFQAKDVIHAIPELNLPEVLNYAKTNQVGTRLWMNWAGLAKDVDHSLDTYVSWGIEGIMLDFLNRDDQEMVRFYSEILKKTAARHLTVNFHGMSKPTGVGRTYPNLLNHEAVLGTEYNKWSETGSTPEHELMVAYIRMMAGPVDTHQGSFRPVAVKDYKMSYIAPRAMGTLARQLALYIVYENHLPMYADYPEAYEAHPEEFAFVKSVPVVWDDTKVPAGEFPKHIALARRSGRDWFLGAITDRAARTVELPLTFLSEGRYQAEIYSDKSDSEDFPEHVEITNQMVTARNTLSMRFAPGGGQAIHFKRLD